MSIKRYNISGLHPHIIEDKDGFMVYYEDYARLHSLIANSEQENASLKAEVERLDNLVRYWSEKYQNENARFLRASERIAAKEGKQP